MLRSTPMNVARVSLRTGALIAVMILLITEGVAAEGVAAEGVAAEGVAAEGVAAEDSIKPVFQGVLEPCCSSPLEAQPESSAQLARDALDKMTSAMPQESRPDLDLDLEGDEDGWSKMALAPSPPIRARFNGLDQAQAAHQGQDSFPPDTSIAAGERRVLQAANSALRLSNLNGSNPVVKSLNDFFGIPDAPVLFQPKVYYDRMTKRFYVAALSVDQSNQESAIHIAFSTIFDDVNNLELSRTFRDGGTWCAYQIAANFGAGVPAFTSTLALGQNEKWIALGTDHLKYQDGGFRSSVLHAIDKLSLSNFVSGPCPTLSFARLNVTRDADGKKAVALQPAQHYTNNELPDRPLYLVSTQTLLNTSSLYTLWRLQGDDTTSLTLSRSRLRGGFNYTQPPPATQRGGLDLETGDTRITQAAFRDGKLWAIHATGCQLGQAPEESCLRLVEITPNENGGELTHQENLGRANLFLWGPGLAVNFHGDVLVPFQRSQNGQRLGLGYVVRRAAKGSFDAMRNLSSGQCPLANLDDNGANLTELSAGAQTDPRDNFGFWVAGEYPGNFDDLGCNWRTRIGLARDRPAAGQPPIVLARGEFILPTATTPTSPNYQLEVELNAVVPNGLGNTTGRSLVIALHDAGRADIACVRDHPSNGCASVDYPLTRPNLRNSNWAALELGNRRQTLYLTESQDLSRVPDPLKPD